MTIIIAGTIKLASGRAAQFVQEASPFIEASRTEPGCISYCWTADVVDDGNVCVYEHWASVDALATHFQAPSYMELGGMLFNPDYGFHGSTVQKHRVDRTEPIFDQTGSPSAAFTDQSQ